MLKEPLRDYFQKLAAFLTLVQEVERMIRDGRIQAYPLMSLKDKSFLVPGYNKETIMKAAIANPTYACKILGKKYGKLLSFLYTELRGTIVYAFESRIYNLTIYLELFLEVYTLARWEDEFTPKDMRNAIKSFMYDYCDELIYTRTREMSDPDYSFARDIIMESDLKDLSYLYRYGEYISDNELGTASFINSLSEEEVMAMANTFTEGFRKGFEVSGLDLSDKTNMNIRYQIGFERVIRQAIYNFNNRPDTISISAAYIAINKRQHKD